MSVTAQKKINHVYLKATSTVCIIFLHYSENNIFKIKIWRDITISIKARCAVMYVSSSYTVKWTFW